MSQRTQDVYITKQKGKNDNCEALKEKGQLFINLFSQKRPNVNTLHNIIHKIY